MTSTEIANSFIRAINRHDVDAMLGLMSSHHVLVDGSGTELTGVDRLRTAWTDYFSMFPDYTIHVDQVFSDGNRVAVFGRAEGTYSPEGSLKEVNHWQIPAAWLALLEGEKISTWQVFADNEPVRQIVARY